MHPSHEASTHAPGARLSSYSLTHFPESFHDRQGIMTSFSAGWNVGYATEWQGKGVGKGGGKGKHTKAQSVGGRMLGRIHLRPLIISHHIYPPTWSSFGTVRRRAAITSHHISLIPLFSFLLIHFPQGDTLGFVFPTCSTENASLHLVRTRHDRGNARVAGGSLEGQIYRFVATI